MTYTRKETFMKIWGYKNYTDLKRICNKLNIPYNDKISENSFNKIVEYHKIPASVKMKNIWAKRTKEEKQLIGEKTRKTQLNFSEDKKKIKEDKRQRTCLEKYGVTNPTKNLEVKNKIKYSWDKEKELFCEENNCTPLLDISNYNSSNYDIDKIVIKNMNSNFIENKNILYIKNNDIDKFKKERNKYVRQYKGENYIEDYLISKSLPYKKQKSFDDCKYKHKLLFDFMIGDNILLEINGIQHYKPVSYYGNIKNQFQEQQKKDQIKRDFCKNNNYNFISIPWLCKGITTKKQLLNKLEEELDNVRPK